MIQRNLGRSLGCLTILLSCLGISEVCQATTIEWARLQDSPDTVCAAALAVADGKLYAFGGLHANWSALNYSRVYDPATNTWSSASPMPVARSSGGCGVLAAPGGQKEIYFVGGCDASGSQNQWVGRYLPATNTWENVAPLPEARGTLAGTAVVNNQLYVMGGSHWAEPLGQPMIRFNTNQVYDRSSNTWINKTPVPEKIRCPITAVWDDKIYLFGGDTDSAFLDTTYIYDTVTDTWTTGADVPRSVRNDDAHLLVWDNRIYLMGSNVDHDSSTWPLIDVYDPEMDTWSSTDAYPGGNSLNPQVIADGNRVYVLGNNWYQGASTSKQLWVGEIVPEPASLSLLAFGGLAVMRRKRGGTRL